MKCRCCGRKLPETEFRRVKSLPVNGLPDQHEPVRRRRECRDCERAIADKTNKRIAADPKLRAKRRQQQQEFRERNREKVREYQRLYHREYRKLQRQRTLL